MRNRIPCSDCALRADSPAGEHAVRGIVGYIFFFTIGLVSAGAYFYQLHPEASMDADLPRLRKDVDEAVERGKRLRDAWDKTSPAEEASAVKPGKESVRKD